MQHIWGIPRGKVTEAGWSKLGMWFRVQVCVLERGQMVWCLLRGLFSQTSRPWWLTFGDWVTHPCFSLNPETITGSHHSSNRHSIITWGWMLHRWHSVPLLSVSRLIWVRQSILGETHFYLSINPSAMSVNNTKGSVGWLYCNYSTFIRLLIIIFHFKSSVWDKLYSCSLSLSEVISSHLNAMSVTKSMCVTWFLCYFYSQITSRFLSRERKI